jgi:Mg2+ and Co2+ transporter CorA
VFEAIAIVAVSISIAWVTYKLLMPLIKAFAARIEGKGGAQLEQRLHELEQRVMDGDQAQQRLAELEERLDFAERLLSQREEPLKLRREGEPS